MRYKRLPGSGRSPGERNGNLPQYSYMENSMDRRAWRTIVHGVSVHEVAESDTTEHVHTHTHKHRHTELIKFRIF